MRAAIVIFRELTYTNPTFRELTFEELILDRLNLIVTPLDRPNLMVTILQWPRHRVQLVLTHLDQALPVKHHPNQSQDLASLFPRRVT